MSINLAAEQDTDTALTDISAAVMGAGIVNNVKIAHIPTVLIFLSGLVEKLDQLGGLLIQLRLGHTDQSHVSASLDV